MLFFRIKEFLNYYWRANTIYDVHSPKTFQFASEILEDKRDFYIFDEIEKNRNRLLVDEDRVVGMDMGAGSSVKNSSRRVKDVARNALTTPYFCRILFKIAHLYKPEYILELGTCLGIGSSYLASGYSKTKMYTIEGNTQLKKMADRVFQNLQLQNINSIEGDFDQVLNEVAPILNSNFIIFLDGNHQKIPTLKYFNILLQNANNNSIFIFDDIYWSPDMKEAWNEIKRNEKVRLTIDLYQFGIVFTDQAILEKQHFTLIPKKFKPWRFGFFTRGVLKT